MNNIDKINIKTKNINSKTPQSLTPPSQSTFSYLRLCLYFLVPFLLFTACPSSSPTEPKSEPPSTQPVSSLTLSTVIDNTNPTMVHLSWVEPTNDGPFTGVEITCSPSCADEPFKIPKGNTNHSIAFPKGSLSNHVYTFNIVSLNEEGEAVPSTSTNASTEVIDFVYEWAEHGAGANYTSVDLSPTPPTILGTNVMIDTDPNAPGLQTATDHLQVQAGGITYSITNITFDKANGLKIFVNLTGPLVLQVNGISYIGSALSAMTVGSGVIYTFAYQGLLELQKVNHFLINRSNNKTPPFAAILVTEFDFIYSIDEAQNGGDRFEIVENYKLRPTGSPSGDQNQRLDFEVGETRPIIRIQRKSDTNTVLGTYYVRINVTDVAGQ